MTSLMLVPFPLALVFKDFFNQKGDSARTGGYWRITHSRGQVAENHAS